jgi:hypothetical protein
MRNGFVRAMMVMLALSASATAASAQISMGVGAGPAVPVSGLDGFGSGIHAQGTLSLSLPLLPIGFRGDLLFQRLPGEGERSGQSYRQFAGVASATLDVLPIPLFPVRPYLIGGVGLFNHAVSGGEHADGADRGISAGGGVRVGLPGLRILVEARVQSVFAEGGTHVMIPLVAGLSF